MSASPASEPHYLWLIPEDRALQRLDILVKALASRLDAAVFPPHVTLLGRLSGPPPELSFKTERLATLLAPFEARVMAVEHRDEFFRSLFLRIALDEALAEAHRQAREIFGSTEAPGSYMPHLSILYGSFPATRKEAIRNELRAAVPTSLTLDRLQLVAGGTQPEDWVPMTRFPLCASGA